MRIHVISDTHGKHNNITINNDVDCIIHAGDSTNYFDLIKNQSEFDDFLEWYKSLDVKYKIIISGNHDAWSTKKYNKEALKDANIIYLEHDYCNLEGIRFFGSPYTPNFGKWYHMKERSNLDKY